MHAIDDFTYIADTCSAGRIHFKDIDMAPLHNRGAMLAFSAWLSGGATCAIGANTVHPLGNNTRCGGFARAANTGHDKGLGDPIRGKGVAQCAHHRLLANKVGKGLRAVFTGKDGIVGHTKRFRCLKGM